MKENFLVSQSSLNVLRKIGPKHRTGLLFTYSPLYYMYIQAPVHRQALLRQPELPEAANGL